MVLPSHFRVLYPSHPEFGGSGRPELCDTVEELTFHYLDLLDELGIEKVHVVGHSFGGWLAAELGVRHPPYVDRLVLSNPLGVWLTEEPVPDVFALNAQQVVELAYQDQDIGQDAVPADADQEEQWFADWSAIARYGWNPFLHNPTLADHLHRVKAPTLVIASDDDRITGPGYAHAFAERVPGAELKTVANSGHALPLERPAEFSALVTEFLSTNAAPAG